MKYSKTCPKCGGTDILRVEDSQSAGRISLTLDWITVIPVARYVCCGCGYVESWVDKRDLWQIRAKQEKEKNKK